MGRLTTGVAMALAALTLLGCGDTSKPPADDADFAERFLSEREYRRVSLEQAVVNPANGYSALRLAQYATERDDVPTGWDALDEWNPPVRPLVLGADEPAAKAWDGHAPSSTAAWLALGQRAFELWPVEIDDASGALALDAEDRETYGMWTDNRARVAGLVYVTTADGREHAAWTCSGCHARPGPDGNLVYGAPAAALDRGAMSAPMPDGSAPESWSWGKGNLDVTADGIDNPTAILDLRATAHQSHLHWEATLKNGLPALAVRIETLLIESAHEKLRPPRTVAIALALYVESLGARGGPGNAADAPEGAAIFDAECASCHHADGSTAPPVPASVVGTDPVVANSPMRGNGVYRVPSLWAVADRGLLLHNGRVPDLATFLDPARVALAQGHPFGLDLDPAARASLIEFVETIGR